MSNLPLPLPLLVGLAGALGLILVLLAVGKVPLRYNIRNLAVRWRTTLMTGLAFTLVVFLLTVMLAFVNGMRHLTEDSGDPKNVVVMSDGATDEAFSNLAFTDTSDLPGMLDQPNKDRLARTKDGKALVSREVYLVVAQPMGPPGPNGEPPRRSFIQVRGIEDQDMARQVHQLELLPGGEWFKGTRPLPGSTSGEQAVEAVLGEGVAREFGRASGKERLQVGDVFDLGPRKWIVSGILKSAGSTTGSEVWARSTLVGDMFGKKAVFTSMFVRTRGPEEAIEVAKALSSRELVRRASFLAQTEPQYFAALGATNKQFLGATIIVAIIIGIGGVFGVMNTMFAAVSQRTKDIGVLRILGFARWQVLVSFFLESLVIALIGGLIGLGVGSLVHGTSATSIVSSGQGGGKSVVLTLTVDATVVGVALLFSLGMGALGGLVPSLNAMRLRPLESLR